MALRFALITAFCITAAYAGNPWEPVARDANWVKQHEALVNQTKQHGSNVKVVFLGDSLTQGWSTTGKDIWDEHYASRGAFNYGIGGDKVENVLYRIEHGEFDGLKPKFIVLMIGKNNVRANVSTASDLAKGVQTILNSLHTKMPNAKVIIMSLPPCEPANVDTLVHNHNKLIGKFADYKRVHFLDFDSKFETSLGHERAGLFSPDHVNLTAKGYELWYNFMEPLFNALYLTH